nr:reverse transcriptase domain-containing protein [Tanacetum cinerariifolium]
IMQLRMRTRSAARPASESLGGERVYGLVEVEGVEDLRKNLLPVMLARVGNQGNVRNQNGNVVNENVQDNVRNVLVNGNRVGCSYKEFLVCNHKEYDGFCPSHEMQKLEIELWNQSMVGVSHAAYTDRFYELARLVPHLVTPESRKIMRYVYVLALQIRRIMVAMKPKIIQKDV